MDPIKPFPSSFMSVKVPILFMFFGLNYFMLISQKVSAGQNAIHNLAGIATKFSLQFHNYFMYSLIPAYN
jgi:hypothetical protein